MSVTPDIHYHGENTCRCCGKEMLVNDTGITYHTYLNKHHNMNDLMFCVSCAIDVTRAMVQDIKRVDPMVAFADHHYASELRRYATALKNLADSADSMAELIDFETGVTHALRKQTAPV